MSKEEIARQMNDFISGSSPAVTEEKPVETEEEEVITDIRQDALANPPVEGAEWKKRVTTTKKTTDVRCIVIDKNDRWHQEAVVDLKGIDTTPFTWGYYGPNLPVLVEDDEGQLHPWIFKDQAGESSNRLYKAANPSGYKATFKHRYTLMQKIQVGLMVALVLGLFFLMFILINN